MFKIKDQVLDLPANNTLFLQAPIGRFFKLLASYLDSHHQAKSFQITFNGGDEFFGCSQNLTPFTETPDQWYQFLRKFMITHNIMHVVVFGDCRFYHRIAKQVSRELGAEFWVFEEGYLRPTFVTFEQQGANGYSLFDQKSINNLQLIRLKTHQHNEVQLPNAFWYMTLSAVQYYFFKTIRSKRYPHYIHHRPTSALQECRNWLLSGIRKCIYKISERKLSNLLHTQYAKQYFLVPLQVSVDSQITFHSPYHSVKAFIKSTIHSFSTSALATDALVFKHHPMDRGFNHYQKYINEICQQCGVSGRVFYCHDLHLPTLLRNAKGTVTINSTVGISSLQHNVPTKVMGKAIYNIKGLTSQKSLDEFWLVCCPPCEKQFAEFKSFLKITNQINGSFYQQETRIFESVAKKMYKKVRQKRHANDSMSEAS